MLDYEANSKEERRLAVYRLLFKMERLVRVERKRGKFATKWRIIRRKSIGEYLDEELLRHKLRMIKDCVSKCEKHVPRITQCKDSGRIYDEKNCMIFNDDEEWGMFEKGDRNVGEKMECLIDFLKRRDRDMQFLSSRAQQFNDGVVKSEREVKSIEIPMTHPPPDGQY